MYAGHKMGIFHCLDHNRLNPKKRNEESFVQMWQQSFRWIKLSWQNIFVPSGCCTNRCRTNPDCSEFQKRSAFRSTRKTWTPSPSENRLRKRSTSSHTGGASSCRQWDTGGEIRRGSARTTPNVLKRNLKKRIHTYTNTSHSLPSSRLAD